MSENKLDKARELLKKNHYFLDWLKDNDEWNKLNVLHDEIIILFKEYIDNMLDEVNQGINYAEDDIERRKEYSWHLNGMFHVLQCIIYDYNLDEYYEKIVSTYETINLDEYLISSQIEYGAMYSHHSYLCDIILRDKEYKNFSKEYDNIFDDLYPDKKYYPFDTNERFFGFLPVLYNSKRMDLFYRLLDVLYDLIINFGSKSTTLIKDLYNYSKILNEDRFIDGLKNALRQLLKNSIKYNDFDFDNTIDSYIGKSNLADIIIFNNEIYKFIDLDTMHFDKEKELAFVRRIYSTLYIKYGDIIRKLELISNTIDYYKVSIFILDEWKNSINEYFINLLKDIDKNIDFDTSFVDMNRHSIYYVNYLKNVKKPYNYVWKIVNNELNHKKSLITMMH